MEKGLTLVIPLYNKAKYLRQTLDTVFNNHGEYPFKCIIIDDDSTDGSSKIAEEYDIAYPDIFQYIKIKHHGHKTPVNARNFGIRLAETEYIGFLDADDELCHGFIDRGCGFLDEHPEYSLYGCGNKRILLDDKGEKYLNYFQYLPDIPYTFETFFQYGYIWMHFTANIYKTELVKKYPFTDCYFEDATFKMKYIYYNPNIYIDSTTCESVLFNAFVGGSTEWNIPPVKNVPIDYLILKNVIKQIPDFRYNYKVDENGMCLLWDKQQKTN